MFWDGGHAALEEVLFTQTLLCLHHRDLNPDLYQANRTVVLKRPDALVDASKTTAGIPPPTEAGPATSSRAPPPPHQKPPGVAGDGPCVRPR
jgi:hypothetical protein